MMHLRIMLYTYWVPLDPAPLKRSAWGRYLEQVVRLQLLLSVSNVSVVWSCGHFASRSIHRIQNLYCSLSSTVVFCIVSWTIVLYHQLRCCINGSWFSERTEVDVIDSGVISNRTSASFSNSHVELVNSEPIIGGFLSGQNSN